MIISWLLHTVDSFWTSMAAALPAWTFTIQAGSWITAIIDWMRQYEDFIPVHDALIPVLELHYLLYSVAIAIRITMIVVNVVRGSGSGSGSGS